MKDNKKDNAQDQAKEIMQEQQQTKKVKDVLAENVIMIQGLTYTHSEAKKFLPIFEKIEGDLIACVQAIEKAEQEKKEEEKDAEINPE